MRAASWLGGAVTARVTGTFPAGFLNALSAAGIPFSDVGPEDEWTLRLNLRARDLARARELAPRCGCALEAGESRGLPSAAGRLRRRLGFLIGAVLALGLLFWSSLYIWDIRVTENPTEVPDARILEALSQTGVGVGSFWPDFTSDMIRSRALALLPELGWLTVNVRGSRAEVLVRGRIPPPELRSDAMAADVTAAKSGVITELRVLEGTPLVEAGDTVLAGDVLVSSARVSAWAGERRVHARAECTARTWHELTAFAPLTAERKQLSGPGRTRFALLFGTRRINFYADSGKLPGECDKIIKIWRLELPGVFTLPVALYRETRRAYDTETAARDPEEIRRTLEARLEAELRAALGDEGTVTSAVFSASEREGRLYVTLRAECLERIDQERLLS